MVRLILMRSAGRGLRLLSTQIHPFLTVKNRFRSKFMGFWKTFFAQNDKHKNLRLRTVFWKIENLSEFDLNKLCWISHRVLESINIFGLNKNHNFYQTSIDLDKPTKNRLIRIKFIFKKKNSESETNHKWYVIVCFVFLHLADLL